MCFNYKVSLLTFVISFITSGLWIFYGNNKYHNENVVYGISFSSYHSCNFSILYSGLIYTILME